MSIVTAYVKSHPMGLSLPISCGGENPMLKQYQNCINLSHVYLGCRSEVHSQVHRHLREADQEARVRPETHHPDWARKPNIKNASAFDAGHSCPALAEGVDHGL